MCKKNVNLFNKKKKTNKKCKRQKTRKKFHSLYLMCHHKLYLINQYQWLNHTLKVLHNNFRMNKFENNS